MNTHQVPGVNRRRIARRAWSKGLGLAVGLGLGMGLGVMSFAAQAADVTVSAAASLTNAFKELAPAFEARHPGTRLQLNFAASDALLAQIAKGAPVDVFASADQETMDRAEQQKLLAAGSRRDFVSNSLVLITPVEGGLPLKSLADLQQAGVKRVAIGKPEGVPAGRYAKGALEAAKLWSVVEPKAVFAQNVRQALDYVSRGEAEAGFVYGTDALVQKDKVRILLTVPTETPIRYPLALINQAPNATGGKAFIDYVLSAEGQAVLAKYGFSKP
ncbi:molybdate transport system substrate-binding protein [Roseateles sp. YR242]|uniref:molybdate ABC transporter substrate-binding protein n=1 Tax=Roseateles sp. YR242 TaxID=1855305 RepID=UPI0008BAF280|nr:molybdate ABC transporter substrate-binding protein [Roseateles sp. YR242]SEK82652.1 molybdate transport system substrate-binding protein [Roseateles sp. YR242]